MSVSFASTLTHSLTAASHGNPRSGSIGAMDVDRDPLPPRDTASQISEFQPNVADLMDTALESTRPDATETTIPGLHATEGTAPSQQPTTQSTERDHREASSGDRALEQAQQAPPFTNLAIMRNTLSVYQLDPLVATVARTDPATGEKINKMRKSYEGQLKTMGLSGRNKAVRHDDMKRMGLSEMAAWPAEEWQHQKTMGKDVTIGLSDGIMGKLGKAMQMQAGRVPDNEYWEDLLGMEKNKASDPNAKTAKAVTAGKTNGQQANGVRPPATGPATNAPQASEHIRARRTTKKRRYDEGSFEGYGEGYVDDEMDGGYSSGESRGTRTSAGNRKRRKTKDYGNSPSEFPSKNSSFTAGPVGISAYSR